MQNVSATPPPSATADGDMGSLLSEMTQDQRNRMAEIVSEALAADDDARRALLAELGQALALLG